ncbi:MAG: hypothetical protein IPL32_20345 [Chloracidobacterium sp.]|nr:hypothetical protein [Chloracidobacterium sp.]MBK8468172.1 hypothetical protein [Chloracidobacterium sp.]
MTTAIQQQAIDEITHVSGVSVAMVWIYGQMVWAELPAFRFIALRGRQQLEVSLMAGQVKRYRDGESQFFLIEMPLGMAIALDLTEFVLPPDELERMKRNIDVSRAW